MNTSPDAYYSKKMLRDVFQCAENRIHAAARKIAKHEAYVENGDNSIAPLWAWMDVLKTIPKNPRPYRPKGAKR
ncbi:hypothetical protein GYB59_14445 [bacterium]|nr:hypothetical protein [bacterium]